METFRLLLDYSSLSPAVAFLLGSGINGNGVEDLATDEQANLVAFLLGSGINGNFEKTTVKDAVGVTKSLSY